MEGLRRDFDGRTEREAINLDLSEDSKDVSAFVSPYIRYSAPKKMIDLDMTIKSSFYIRPSLSFRHASCSDSSSSRPKPTLSDYQGTREVNEVEIEHPRSD